jgi:hypothetical protein
MVLGYLHWHNHSQIMVNRIKSYDGWRMEEVGAAHRQHSDFESCNSTTGLTIQKQQEMHISSPIILHMKQTPVSQTSASEIVATTGTDNNSIMYVPTYGWLCAVSLVTGARGSWFF